MQKSLFSQTCLMPWKAQSQNSRRAQRNDAWNTESNILGTQLFTRKLSGNSGSVKQKTIPILTYAIPFKTKLRALLLVFYCFFFFICLLFSWDWNDYSLIPSYGLLPSDAHRANESCMQLSFQFNTPTTTFKTHPKKGVIFNTSHGWITWYHWKLVQDCFFNYLFMK